MQSYGVRAEYLRQPLVKLAGEGVGGYAERGEGYVDKKPAQEAAGYVGDSSFVDTA